MDGNKLAELADLLRNKFPEEANNFNLFDIDGEGKFDNYDVDVIDCTKHLLDRLWRWEK